MRWDLDTRRKLARMVRDLSQRVQLEELKRGRNYSEVLDATDRRIMGMLAPLGFTRANKDWELEVHNDLMIFKDSPTELEAHNDLMIFKDSPTHLWFETAQARIVKISKRDAEKVLVLGFP